jgi:hypothetical protein
VAKQHLEWLHCHMLLVLHTYHMAAQHQVGTWRCTLFMFVAHEIALCGKPASAAARCRNALTLSLFPTATHCVLLRLSQHHGC